MSILDVIMWMLISLISIVVVYIIVRFASLAVFTSYFDAKHQSKRKGEHDGKSKEV